MTRIQRGYLEYFLVDHCNLRCAHCSHFSPFMPPRSANLEDLERDLKALAEVMQVGRLRLLGGEPLLNRQLPDFIDIIRESQIAREIGLCTNGVLLHKARPETLAKLDWLDVSLYPGTIPDSATIKATAQRICQELGLKLSLYEKPEFRYQIIDQPIEDDSTVQAIFDSCKIAHGGFNIFHDGCHTFYQGHYYRCNRPAYTRQYLVGGREQDANLPDFSEIDGVCLHRPDLKQRLVEYLLDDQPLKSCRWCLGTCGVKQPHRMLTREEIKQRAPSQLALEEVLDREALARDQEAVRPVKSRTRQRLKRHLPRAALPAE